MGRPKRSAPGGWVYHVLNRANARMQIFTKDEDFIAFETVLQEAVARTRSGHLYQGRFKSFPVQDDGHFLTVCRYVERNALRANLVKQAEDWRCSSLHRWSSGIAAEKELLSPWPVRRNAGWLEHVNSPQTDAELAAIRRSVNRGSPFGDETWATTATKKTRPRNHDSPTRTAKTQINGS